MKKAEELALENSDNANPFVICMGWLLFLHSELLFYTSTNINEEEDCLNQLCNHAKKTP